MEDLLIGDGRRMENRFRLLIAPFFLSGFAALVYQVCWQRLLVVALGVENTLLLPFSFGWKLAR
jgi:hypothetical protein